MDDLRRPMVRLGSIVARVCRGDFRDLGDFVLGFEAVMHIVFFFHVGHGDGRGRTGNRVVADVVDGAGCTGGICATGGGESLRRRRGTSSSSTARFSEHGVALAEVSRVSLFVVVAGIVVIVVIVATAADMMVMVMSSSKWTVAQTYHASPSGGSACAGATSVESVIGLTGPVDFFRGGDFEHLVAVKDLAAENAVFAFVAFESFDAFDPFPDDDTSCGRPDPSDITTPPCDVWFGDVEHKEDNGDQDGTERQQGHETDVLHLGVEEGEPVFGKRVEDDPGGVEQVQGEFEQVAERRNGIVVASGPRAITPHQEVIEDGKGGVEHDQREPNPFDHDLFLVSREQTDEGLHLGQPQKGAGNNAHDANLHAVDDFGGQGFGVGKPIVVLSFGHGERVGTGDGQRHGHQDSSDFLQPRTTPNPDSRRTTRVRAADDAMTAQKTRTTAASIGASNVVRARGDEQDHNQQVADHRCASDRVELRRDGRVKGIASVENRRRVRN